MSTLKNLVNESTNIKNELIACYNNLKNNLISKGVQYSESDKLFDMVEKVGAIEAGGKWANGSFTIDYNNRITSTKSFTINCDFTPRMFFVRLNTVYCAREVTKNVFISNLFSTTINEDTTYYITLRVSNISSTNFTISVEKNYANATNLRDGLTWYAFE